MSKLCNLLYWPHLNNVNYRQINFSGNGTSRVSSSHWLIWYFHDFWMNFWYNVTLKLCSTKVTLLRQYIRKQFILHGLDYLVACLIFTLNRFVPDGNSKSKTPSWRKLSVYQFKILLSIRIVFQWWLCFKDLLV